MSRINEYLEGISYLAEELFQNHPWFKAKNSVQNFKMEDLTISIEKKEHSAEISISSLSEETEAMEHVITVCVYKPYNSETFKTHVSSLNMSGVSCSSEKDFNLVIGNRIELAHEAISQFAEKMK